MSHDDDTPTEDGEPFWAVQLVPVNFPSHVTVRSYLFGEGPTSSVIRDLESVERGIDHLNGVRRVLVNSLKSRAQR